jgi:predicted small integral membrane protein
VLLHISGSLAPFFLSFSLLGSGVSSTDTEPYWLIDIIGRPNSSYFAEPFGFLYMLVVGTVAAALFALAPVALWRRLYRDRAVIERDWTSVDSAFTLLVITGVMWVFRAVAGYGDGIFALATIVMILSAYVPIFSSLLALGMPVVPGSGRIGGILPGFLRVKFTERFLLTDEDREVLRLFEAAKAEAKPASP